MDGIKQYVKMHKYGLKCLAIINICEGGGKLWYDIQGGMCQYSGRRKEINGRK